MGVPKAGEEEGIKLDGAGVAAAWNTPALRNVVEISDRLILFDCDSFVSVKCSGIGKTAARRTRIVESARREDHLVWNLSLANQLHYMISLRKVPAVHCQTQTIICVPTLLPIRGHDPIVRFYVLRLPPLRDHTHH